MYYNTINNNRYVYSSINLVTSQLAPSVVWIKVSFSDASSVLGFVNNDVYSIIFTTNMIPWIISPCGRCYVHWYNGCVPYHFLSLWVLSYVTYLAVATRVYKNDLLNISKHPRSMLTQNLCCTWWWQCQKFYE